MKDCKGCGKKPVTSVYRRPTQSYSARTAPQTFDVVADDDFILIKFESTNLSQRHIYGNAQFEQRMRVNKGMRLEMQGHPQGGWRFYYGYHGGGETFMVHRADADLERSYAPVQPVRAVKEIELPRRTEKRDLPPPPPPPTHMTVEDVIGGPEEDIDGRAQLEEELDGVSPMAYDVLSNILMREVRGNNRIWAIAMIKEKLDGGQEETGAVASPSAPTDAPPTLPPPPTPPPARRPTTPHLDESDEVPYSITNTIDLQQLPGVGKSLSDALREDGYETLDDLVSLGIDGLIEYKGVGETKAERIIGAAQAFLAK